MFWIFKYFAVECRTDPLSIHSDDFRNDVWCLVPNAMPSALMIYNLKQIWEGKLRL